MSDKEKALDIQMASIAHFEQILRLYRLSGIDMHRKGFANWSYFYPSVSIILNDLNKKELYILFDQHTVLGAISITSQADPKYHEINWVTRQEKALYINRLAVHPRFQSRGFGSLLMDFALQIADKTSCTSIRLDAYSPNDGLLQFYQKRGFIIHKETISLGKPWQHPFCCLEKCL